MWLWPFNIYWDLCDWKMYRLRYCVVLRTVSLLPHKYHKRAMAPQCTHLCCSALIRCQSFTSATFISSVFHFYIFKSEELYLVMALHIYVNGLYSRGEPDKHLHVYYYWLHQTWIDMGFPSPCYIIQPAPSLYSERLCHVIPIISVERKEGC